MALQLFESITPTNKANALWAGKQLEEILWDEYTENVQQIFKKREAKKELVVRTEAEADLEEMTAFINKPSTESLSKTLKSLFKIQKNGTSLETTFSRIFLNRSICVARHLKALQNFEGASKKKRKRKKKKKEKPPAPIVSIAIKTAVAFFLSLLKHSTRLTGAEDLLEDMLDAMNDILLSLDPLALYDNPPPELGNQSLDKAAKFVHTCVSEGIGEKNRILAINLLCNLALQRGTLSSLLKFISFLTDQDEQTKVPLEGFQPLISFLTKLRQDLIESFKQNDEKEDSGDNGDNSVEESPVNAEGNSSDLPLEPADDAQQQQQSDSIITQTMNNEATNDSTVAVEINKKSEDSEFSSEATDAQMQEIESESKLKKEDIEEENEIKEENEIMKTYEELFENKMLENLLKQLEGKTEISLSELGLILLGTTKDLGLAVVTTKNNNATRKDDCTGAIDDIICFGIGANNYEQLDPSTRSRSPTPQPSYCERSALQIEPASECSFILDGEGNLWSRGKGDYGRLGSGGTSNSSHFSSIHIPISISFFAVSPESYGHGLAVDENGKIWSWGDGDYGKLGHGDTNQCPTPRLIDFFRMMRFVSCGETFSAAATSEGKCYTWGGRSLGVDSSDETIPQEVTAEIAGVHVNSVHCGGAHMFVIGDGGRSIYGWGSNDENQVGGEQSEYSLPFRIEALCGIGVVDIVGSSAHSLALTNDGTVYAWGDSSRTGLHPENRSIPSPVDSLSNIICIAAAFESFALDNSGVTYRWSSSRPEVIEELEGIKQIRASGTHVLFHNIPRNLSSAPPVVSSPFAVELTEGNFSELQQLLECFHIEDSTSLPTEQQLYRLECILCLLRANLYHLNATSTELPNLELGKIRKILLHILNASFLPPTISQVCRNIFEESWEILIPSLGMQTEILETLLPSSGNREKMSAFNETECFLLDVIVSSLIKNSEFAKLLKLSCTVDDNVDEEIDENSSLSQFIAQVHEFLDFVTMEAIQGNSGIFDKVSEPLIKLLSYFHVRILANFESNHVSTKTIAPWYISKLFSSSSNILISITEATMKPKKLLKFLRKTYLSLLLPHAATVLHFLSTDKLQSIISEVIDLLSILDEVNRTCFASLLQTCEMEEFSGGDSDIECSSSESWLLDVERILASLVGENYSRMILPNTVLSKEQKDLFSGDLFNTGIYDKSSSGSMIPQTPPLLQELVQLQEKPLFLAIEHIARDKLLLSGSDEDYPPMKEFICVMAATMIKLLGLTSTATKLSENLNAEPSSRFLSMIDELYAFRENIFADMNALNLDLSQSAELEKVHETECAEIGRLCAPFIERALFLFHQVSASEENSMPEFTNIMQGSMDLRASAPVFMDTAITNHSIIRSMDDNTPKIRRNRQGITSVARALRQFKSGSEKSSNSLLRDIISFVKSDFSIDTIKSIVETHIKCAKVRKSSIDALSGLVKEIQWIPSVQLVLIKGSFQLLFKGVANTKDINEDIPLAPKKLREEIEESTTNLYKVLLSRIVVISQKLLTQEKPSIDDQCILTTFIRAITSPLVSKQIFLFINGGILPVLVQLLQSDMKSSPFHPALARASTRLFKCLLGAAGLIDENSLATGKIIDSYHQMVSSYHAKDYKIGRLLDHLLRCAVSQSFREKLTSETWIRLLLAADRKSPDDQTMALRVLEAVLPEMVNKGNMQRQSSISRSIFSLLASFLVPKLEKFESEDTSIGCSILDESRSCCYDITGKGEEISLSPTEDSGGIAVLCVSNDMSSPGQYSIRFKVQSEEPEISLSAGVVNRTDFFVSRDFSVSLNGDPKWIVIHLERNLDEQFLKFEILEENSKEQEISSGLLLPSDCAFQITTRSTIKIIKHEFYQTKHMYPVERTVAVPGQMISQEIVELLCTLHATSGWTDIINSYLNEAIVKQSESYNQMAALAMVSGGTFCGLRNAGFVDYTMGRGTLQRLSYDHNIVSIYSQDENKLITKDDFRDLIPLARRPLDASKLPLDNAFVSSLVSFVVPISEELSVEECEVARSSVAALQKISASDKGRVLLTSLDSRDSLLLLLDIAAQSSHISMAWSLDHLQLLVMNLRLSLKLDDPNNEAKIIFIDELIKPEVPENRIEDKNENPVSDLDDNLEEDSVLDWFCGTSSTGSEASDETITLSETFSETKMSESEAFSNFFTNKKTNSGEVPTNEIYMTSLLTEITENPFTSAVRSQANAMQKAKVTLNDVKKFGRVFDNLSVDARRTALFLFQQHLQIQSAQQSIVELLLHPPKTWQMDEKDSLMKIFSVVRAQNIFNSLDDKSSQKLFETLMNLHPNAQILLQEFLKISVNSLFSPIQAVSNNDSEFVLLFPIIKETISSFNDVKWEATVVDWLCTVILSPKAPVAQKIKSSTILANFCSQAKENNENIENLFVGEFAKAFVTSIQTILSIQYSFESLTTSQGSFSHFLQSMASIAYYLKDIVCIEYTDSKWTWLYQYFVVLDTTEAFIEHKPIPKSLSSLTLKVPLDESSPVAPFEDNVRWNTIMDIALLEWQTKQPEDWSEPVIVCSWGKGGEGQLGTVSSSNLTQPRMSNEFGRVACDVYGGERCTFVRTEEGNVYSTGYGDYGRLGVGDIENRRELTSVDFCSSRGSYGSSLAIDSDGKIWSWGDGDYGKLGLGDRNQRTSPTVITNFNGKNIQVICCGFGHSAAASGDGDLYTWGRGHDGRLGHGSDSYYESPRLVESLQGIPVCGIGCGSNFTVVLANEGKSVWSFGGNDHGQLGTGNTNSLPDPVEAIIEFPHTPFVKVACGESFTVLLSKDGKVFTCGQGDLGALGTGEVSSVEVFTPVLHLDSQFVIDIQVGAAHVVALTRDGKVYAWGDNDNGELGLGDNLCRYLPELITFPVKKIKWTSIAAGSHHSFAYAKKLPERYEVLKSVVNREMVSRGRILNKYSDFFFASYKLLNLDPTHGSTFGIEKEVWRFKQESKQQVLRNFINQTTNSSDDTGPTVRLNRFGRSACVFTQLCEQLNDVRTKDLLSKRAWKVEFIGEGSIDAGGPFNESISQICVELQSGKVSIIKPTANAYNKLGNNQDCVFPVSSSRDSVLLQFLGKLFGISVRSHIPLSIQFPPCFWKLLLGHSLKVDDLLEIDESFVNSHKYLLRVDEEGITEETFNDLPLVYVNGQEVTLKFSNRRQYVKSAFSLRLKSWDYAISEIQKGLSFFFPSSLSRLFSPCEFGVLVCGVPEVNWELLKSCTNYSNGFTVSSEVIVWMWEILESLSPDDSGLFLRFVWGKTRLPHSAVDFSRSFEVSKGSGGDNALPTAATCFFEISFPQYSSKKIFKEKLLYAVRNCTSIDTDNNAAPVYFSDNDDIEI